MAKSEFTKWMWFEAVDRISRAQRLHQQFFTLSQHMGGPSWQPPVDVLETDTEVLIFFALPGVDPESVHVVAGERMLLIAGERRRPKVAGHVYHQMEIEYGPFQRQVRLPEDVDPDGAHACFENGVLTVSLPVSATAPAHDRIVIRVELP